MRRTLSASAPTRLDFGGGWTDVPPFPEERGGFVCNLAIERRATVAFRFAPTDGPPSDDGPLVAAALRAAARHGPVGSLHRCALTSDFPVAAGLGGSSAAGVALAIALATLQKRPTDPQALAEWSRAVEVNELGVAGGFQDHYAAAFGGALGLTFGRETTVEQIPLTQTACDALEAQCLLIYTGESRISGTTISAVLNAYADREPRVLQALDRMKTLAMSMRDAIAAGDVSSLAALVDEHWIHQRSLHPKISTERIDRLEEATRRAGASAVKALGASGGGCVIVMAPPERIRAVEGAARAWGELLPWRVARNGARVSWSDAD